MTKDENTAARIEALEHRLAHVEDLLDIYRLAASYGPAVDSNHLTPAIEMWSESASYDLDVGTWVGRDELRALFEGESHQRLVQDGCSHVVTLPRITINGDSAVVTCYQQMIHNSNGRFEIARLSANRWELTRTGTGWVIDRRVSRKLDGDPAARQTLAADL